MLNLDHRYRMVRLSSLQLVNGCGLAPREHCALHFLLAITYW